jgi:signal transduction histidine kinase
MTGNSFFRKHFAISSVVLLIFIALGFFSNFFLMRLSHHYQEAERQQLRHERVRGEAPLLFAKLIDRLNPKDRPQALNELVHMSGRSFPFELVILDANGLPIHSRNKPLPIDIKPESLPTEPYEFFPLTPDHPDRDLDGPHGLEGPGGPPIDEPGLIRFHGEPTQFLLISPRQDLPSLRRSGPPFQFILGSFGSLILSVLLGAGLSLVILFRSLQSKAALADSVIAELQKGNLKARFPIKKMDEIGRAMSRFNRMAEEIERLVEQLQSTERARVTLLQELTHDLRTPVASLKSILETISAPNASALKPEVRAELMEISLKEIDYFERLLEDLLVLAQVSEPRYQTDRSLLSLNDLLDEEAEGVAAQNSSGERRVRLEKNLPETPIEIHGDPHLLKRLFRNALKNAFSFAKNEVRVSLEKKDAGTVEIRIEDDGSGLSEDALKAFGTRRVTRVLDTSLKGRISVGLGSVIMKTVTHLHRGTLSAENKPSGSGAVITIRFPV